MREQIGQMALIASAALALTGCASTTQVPAYPINTAPAPAVQAAPTPVLASIPAVPTASPTTSVTGQPLALPATVSAPAPVPAPVPAPAPAAPPPQPVPIPEERPAPPPTQTYSAPPPAPASITVYSVTGKVIDTQGPPQVHVVKRRDTIDAIARNFDISRQELADANKIAPPYKIKPGQKLKGLRVKAKAYVVGSGDTIYSIALRFKVAPKALAAANGKKVGSSIRSGEKLILPKGYKDTGPLKRVQLAPGLTPPAATVYSSPAYTPATSKPSAVPIAPSAPIGSSTPATIYTRQAPAVPAISYPRLPAVPPATYPRPAPAAPPIIDMAAVPTDADVVAAGRGRFISPVTGEVLGGFGPKGTGQRSDGIDIRSPAGTAVRAAAAGEVVYAGDQVPEFGNLVLIKHSDGWVTAYAHLQRTEVKMRQTVTQGQQIGLVGMSGGVSESQLHFEVRYAPTTKDKARPIDPALVLPK